MLGRPAFSWARLLNGERNSGVLGADKLGPVPPPRGERPRVRVKVALVAVVGHDVTGSGQLRPQDRSQEILVPPELQ